eukprot:363965-Chlamydomonas_euryale.AAC.9
MNLQALKLLYWVPEALILGPTQLNHARHLPGGASCWLPAHPQFQRPTACTARKLHAPEHQSLPS